MKILTASLAALVLATSFVAARAEEEEQAAAPLASYLQSVHQAPAAVAAPLIESRQAAPVAQSRITPAEQMIIDRSTTLSRH